MTKNKKNMFKNKDGLDLNRVKDLTVEETIRKESEIKAGITDTDGILDKYIKQNREKVESKKFDKIDLESLDTGVLDNFIKQQREELAQAGLIEDTVVADTVDTVEEVALTDSVTPTPVSTKSSIFDEVELTETSAPMTKEVDDFVLGDADDVQPVYKNKKWIIGGLAALVLGIFGAGYGLNQLSKQATSVTSTSSSSTSSSSSSNQSSTDTATAKADYNSFTELYGTFFADSEKTKLKNSEFANLPNLETALNKLKGTSYYDKAKADYDKLSKSIAAVQAINSKFETDAIVDGEKVATSLKADANLDDLSSDVLNTGNASLDTLLQSVVSEARTNAGIVSASVNTDTETATSGDAAMTDQATTEQTTVAADQVATTQTPATENTATTSEQTTTAQAGVTTDAATSAATTSVIGSDSSVLQRNLTRVPYNDTAIADTNNPAWAFNPGVLENIINISRARGYFTDNNYYVEPVNIINGNGYYNMFKSDGTYLFSINAKTGYFVGNAPGNADNLDY
ncbi:cell division site-positioning protein MapZ family protein [Streptococcus sp. sy010]|uniref:cell division site-positioning protein MapZ family protein n=1 Tax=Streptococcus sp. sy010 TaxID=2600148 RepID=UPI0011B3E410|nr:cell division site-positioning protein MapZ family protein [Streptococcus sp. sy010]TWT14665.1 hypothetical protein FRX51_03590 [Streptococcus sp. sy010]